MLESTNKLLSITITMENTFDYELNMKCNKISNSWHLAKELEGSLLKVFKDKELLTFSMFKRSVNDSVNYYFFLS